ncbi:MAG: oxygen-dependent coproporphyrinogen oxidase [Bacteriovoracaceae bacterium]|nr:oxygen-dependent coproporphyrinogen oxidase [Bacteriovoracaceae bacterium]
MLTEYKSRFHEHVKHLQEQITQELLRLDPDLKMTEDIWQRNDHAGQPGGGGITRAFEGAIIENAGVNTSLVFGKIDPKFSAQLPGQGDELWAAGISLIIHPRNPRVPTTHANFRMIQHGDKYWFGGGADLTPFYPHEEDFVHFHQTWKKFCEPFECYEKMKKTCDDYFTNLHRTIDGVAEMRGIGGTFFDHYNSGNLENDFQLVTEISKAFIPSYFPIAAKRWNEEYTAADEDFQLHRRGRYVEFNLLHDRGTLFGLKTNGRIDSILISLPARCKFTYRYQPKEAAHLKMLTYYFPKDWV